MKTLVLSLLVACLAWSVAPTASAGQLKESKPAKPRLEVCFVLDTTGSMSGLIEGAKQKIWSIANDMSQAKPTPDIRLGLIGYRDRGDEYVVKSFDLTNDIDAVYGHLNGFSAGGGGDLPESVNEALQAALSQMSWSRDRSVLKIIFLVGDAPPHMDYAKTPQYPEICEKAVQQDLIINTVQCGNLPDTKEVWQKIAKLSEGNYAAIPQEGGIAAIATPYDRKLGELNRSLGTTLVAYGLEPARRAVLAKQAASESAPAAVTADRLAYNARAGKAVQGGGELVDALATGELKLEELKKEQLPSAWQKLDGNQLKTEIADKQKQRREIQAEISKVNRQRDEFLAAERRKSAGAAKSDSFDAQVAATIRAQAARKGINYEKE